MYPEVRELVPDRIPRVSANNLETGGTAHTNGSLYTTIRKGTPSVSNSQDWIEQSAYL